MVSGANGSRLSERRIPMKFSIMDFWALTMTAVIDTLKTGVNVGAFGPKVEGRPFIEWAYAVDTDTLHILLFDHQPGEASQPLESIALAEFGASCFRMADALAPFAMAAKGGQAGAVCDCPECRPTGTVGFKPQGGESFIGFRRPGS